MATTRAQEREDRRPHHEDSDDEEEEGHDYVEYGYGSPDIDNPEAIGEREDERPQLASRYVAVEDRDALDVEETIVNRAGPTLAEVQSLGPIEEIEAELFDKVEREVPAGSGTTKQVSVCKFCAEEFTYMVRDLHTHRNVCPKYPGRESMVRQVLSVPAEDDPETFVDVEIAGEPADEEVTGPDAPVVQEEEEEDESEEERRGEDAEGADVGHDAEEAEDEDETQMLDDEPLAVVVPDRVEVPGDDESESRPRLKVVKPKSTDRDVDMVDAPSGSEGEDTSRADDRGRDDAAERSPTGHTSETASSGSVHNGRDAYRLSFRMVSDSDGEHAECLQCGKICSNRGGAMATHYKKCPAQRAAVQDRPVTRDEKGAALQLMTPKKKPTKRRISGQDFDQLDDEATSQANESDVESHPGSPPLRRSKRFKAESKTDNKTLKPTTEMEPLDLTESTATTDAPVYASRKTAEVIELDDDDPLSQFDLVAAGKRMKCHHCSAEMKFSEDIAEKHLRDCDAYKARLSSHPSAMDTGRTSTASTAPPKKRAKTTERDASGAFAGSLAVLRNPERLRATDIVEMDHETAVAWIFGSTAPIEEMRSRYGKAPMVVRCSPARFRAVEAALYELDVATLLAQMQQSREIKALVPTPGRSGPEYGVMPCASGESALMLYKIGTMLVARAPEAVARMFVPRFAKEVACSPLVATAMHDAELVCANGPKVLDWQYHKDDSFVVCLRGKALWKMQASGVAAPPSCFHPSLTDPSKRVNLFVMQTASVGVGSGQTTVPMPTNRVFDFSNDSDNDEDMDGSATTHAAGADAPMAGQQYVVDAGAVVYIPGGTWYRVEGLEGEMMWLQFQLKTVTVSDLVVDTVRQLVVSQSKMRERVQVAPDGDVTTPQQQYYACVRELASQLMQLSPNELLPEPLLSTKATPAAVVCEVGGKSATRIFEFDLTQPSGFQGGRAVSLLKKSTFRVNPLAVLMRVEELPLLAESLLVNTAPTGATATATPKKALNRKAKRVTGASGASAQGPHPSASLVATASASNGATLAHKTDGVYILSFGLSGVDGQSRLEVQFRCSPPQQVMLDWIRSRETRDAFRVSEVSKVLAFYQGGTARELLKTMLSFLCTMGYLTNVDQPL